MIRQLAALLALQLAGEVTARALYLPVPGPVVGMVFLLVALLILPGMAAWLHSLSGLLLANLSLLFVPAGVGVVGHFDRLGTDGAPILLAILVSTVLAITVGAITFVAVAKWTGVDD